MARDSKPVSFETIAGAIVPAAVIAGAYITAFLTIRGKYRSQYSPRTYNKIIPEKDRTPSTSSSGTSWFRDYRRLNDKFILRHHSFDAFLFLRFFRLLILIAAIGCALTWPILFPLNAKGGGNARELDKFAFGNVEKSKYCWGHAVVAITYFTIVLLLINRERIFTINMRQTYITTKPNALRLSSRTVLFLSVPSEVVENGHFKKIFGKNVKRTWKLSKVDELKSLVNSRDKKINALESAEMKVAQQVVSKQRKQDRNSSNGAGSLDQGDASVDHPHNRPSHRTPPLVGQKLDTINSVLKSMPELETKIDNLRGTYSEDSREPLAIFVEFTNQLHAYQAVQQVQHHDPLALQPRLIGIPPSNVKWQNLALDPALRISYSYIAVAVIIAMTIFWSIPVGFVGTISNIQYLADNYKWLSWINKLPDSVIGLIQGFLPPFALSLLTSYVPFWFRDIAEMSGEPTAQSMEKMTQRWYFVFQFLQVFLVTTLSSGAATIVKRIGERPADIPAFLASNLPKSSNFYLTYFTLQGLSTAASQLIKTSDTFQYVFWKTLSRTPREKYELETKMKGLFFGNVYPKFTNMAVIAIVYSCIAPLVLGFALVGFTLFYFTYRYLYLYSNNAKLEMKGEAHCRALQQMMTGVYVAELCLIGLFSARNARGPSILMTVFFLLTVLHHITVNRYLVPLEQHVPLDVLQAAADANGDGDEDLEANTADDSSEPLLSSSESRDGRLSQRQRRSMTQSLPPFLLDPFKSFLESYSILPSIESIRPYMLPAEATTLGLRDSTLTTVPEYTEQQLKNAYNHPALTSKTPLVWLPKDPAGVSEEFKKRNQERSSLETSDEGAQLDDRGRLVWDESDLSKAPIYKIGPRY